MGGCLMALIVMMERVGCRVPNMIACRESDEGDG